MNFKGCEKTNLQMKIYIKLMNHNDSPMEYWPVYADVECQVCGKVQSLVNYRCNDSECVKCGSKIEI